MLDLTALANGATVSEAPLFDQVVDSGAVSTVALNADGVLATSAFGSLRLWDIHTGGLVAELPVDTNLPPACDLQPQR